MVTTVQDVPLYGGVAPNRMTQQQAEFSANSDNSLAYQATLADNMNVSIGGMNLLTGELNVIASDAEASKDAAALSESNAATSEANASTSEINAASSASQAANDLISANGNPLGSYANNLTFSSHNDYVSESGLFRLKASVNTPYVTNTSTYPLATDDPNLAPWSDANKADINIMSAKLRDIDSATYAGSGFKEWGKVLDTGAIHVINEGLQVTNGAVTSLAGQLSLGYDGTQAITGKSRTNSSTVIVDGVQHYINGVNSNGEDYSTRINFPPAPDGTKTYDSATGVVVEHVDSATAFASETATNKVIISRQDLVFLETWHEKVVDKGVVFPLGNVQNGATQYKGVLLSAVTLQGYSAFGEWDTTTWGLGADWDSLTEEEKNIFLDDPDNNLYYDAEAEELIQVRYRVRVVEGLGDEWLSPARDPILGVRYSSIKRVAPQGKKSVPIDYQTSGGFYEHTNTGTINDIGSWGILTNQVDTTDVVGRHYCTGIALVQRLNQGAYHPVWNSSGCRSVRNINDSGGVAWYDSTAKEIDSTGKCFFIAANGYASPFSGSIGASLSGRSDQYEFYDAIYAGQVQDLRLNANKLDASRLLEDSIRKAVSGETRGWGKVPFTKVANGVASSSSASASYVWLPIAAELEKVEVGNKVDLYNSSTNLIIFTNATVTSKDSSGYFVDTLYNRVISEVYNSVVMSFITAEYDSLPWVDIIGDPVNIAATFPDGVVGQWLPIIPTGGNIEYIMNEKANGILSTTNTDDDGGTWSHTANLSYDAVTNSKIWNPANTRVMLWQYEALSNFTAPDANGAVYGELGDVVATTNSQVSNGNRLHPSLTSKIGKGDFNSASFEYVPVSNWQIGTTEAGRLEEAVTIPNKHLPLSGKLSNINDTPAVKALSHLVEKDGLLYMQYKGSELFYDVAGTVGNEWGDTTASTTYTNAYGVIPVVDNESTQVDLNGNTVKTFNHTELIPIGIASNN